MNDSMTMPTTYDSTSAGDLVAGPTVTVHPKATLRSVAQKIGDLGIGIAVVVEDDVAIGVVSERDLVWAIGRDADLDVVWAADVMTLDFVRVDHSTPIGAVAAKMVEHNTRHLLVGEQDPGVVSMREVVSHLMAKSE